MMRRPKAQGRQAGNGNGERRSRAKNSKKKLQSYKRNVENGRELSGRTKKRRKDNGLLVLSLLFQDTRLDINRVWLSMLLVGSCDREIMFSPSPFAPDHLVFRDRFGRPVPRQPAHALRPGLIMYLVMGFSFSSRLPRRRSPIPSTAIR